MKSTLMFAALSVAFSLPAQALDLKRLVTPETLAAHRAALAFTPEQEAELTRIFESAKAEAAPLEAAVKREEDSVNETLRGTDLDPAAAEAKFTALLEAEGKLKQLQFKTLLALRGILTPEQIEKAVSLEGQTRSVNAPLMATIEEKAGRLKAAFDALEIKPTPELEAEGERIRSLIQSGDLAAADTALDALGKKVGIDEPVDEATIDFSQQAPGDTDLAVLEGRFRAVESAAQKVTFLPKLRQLLQARDALEAAKAAEDAAGVGRVLTWAENLLGITTAP
jgi:Spy/CpxP family protein refolding chaperone